MLLIVGVAFTVEAAAGFGGTVLAVTLAAQFMPVDRVLAILVPVNLLLSGWIAGRHRHSIDRTLLVGSILPWMGAGFLVGLALFQLRGETWLKGLFAVFVIALSVAELVRRTPAPMAPTLRRVVLLAAGVAHGLFACGGPLVVWVVGRESREKARFRATLSALWLCLGVGLLVAYLLAGTIDGDSLEVSALLLVPLVGGLALGEALHHRIPPARFRTGVFVLLLFAGAALLAAG